MPGILEQTNATLTCLAVAPQKSPPALQTDPAFAETLRMRQRPPSALRSDQCTNPVFFDGTPRDEPQKRSSAYNVPAILQSARSRVHRRLERALDFPIAFVCAPAGFGKSTVVHDVLVALTRAHRVLKLGRANTDVVDVLRALAECVGDLAPALLSTFAAVHDGLGDAPDAGEQLATWAARYLVALDALIVVDEVDAACRDRAAEFLTALIDRTQGHLRWIVIAQGSAPFPVARWLAENRMDFPLDATDLGFRPTDLDDAAGVPIDLPTRRRFAQLCTLTGGAPATLALALSNPEQGDEAPLDPAAMYDYFAQGAFVRFGRRSQHLIEHTCLFGSFDAALLEFAGFFDVGANLARLAREPGVLRIDNAGTYEYDRRFRDFNIRRLHALRDGTFELVAARTAAAFECSGLYAAAIDLYVMLGDEDAICLLLTTHGYTLIDAGESGAVQRALAAVPHEILLAFPGALAVKASLESLHGKIDVAEAWFRLALERITDEAQRNDILYRFAIDLVRRERSDVIAILQPVVASIDENAPLAAPLLALLAAAYAQHQQAAQAARTMERALALLPRIGARAVRAKILCQAGFVALFLCDIRAAQTRAEQAYSEAVASYAYDVAARALSVLYSIAIDHDDDVAASRVYVDRLVDASIRAGSRDLLLYATLCRYEIEVYAGNVAEIAVMNEQLASFEVFYSVLTTETLLPSQALQATWSGDFHRAYQLLESSAEHQVTAGRRAHRFAEIAVYAAAAGLRYEALAAADSALGALRETRFVEKTVLITRAYVALTFVLLKRFGRAGKLIRELATAEVHQPRVALLIRAVHALSERWTAGSGKVDLVSVLDELEAAELGGIARMIQALPLPESMSSRVAQLTPAERDILGRLAAGSSSRQIARATARSVQTIDTHITSICRKLGCRGRRHAVAIALTEGLLADAAAAGF